MDALPHASTCSLSGFACVVLAALFGLGLQVGALVGLVRAGARAAAGISATMPGPRRSP